MKLYHRYIFRSVLFSTVAAVALFVFILLAGNAMRDILGLLAAGRLTGKLFIELVFLLIPYVVAYALPLGILTGILIVLGRLSADQEIVALKSSGISLWGISSPVFFLALVGVFLSFLINCYYSPTAKTRYRSLLADAVRRDPLRFIVPHTFIHDFPGYVIYAQGKTGNNLSDFWIWELDEEQRAIKLLRAAHGTFGFDDRAEALVLNLQNGFSELRSERNPDDLQSLRPTVTFKEVEVRLPIGRLLGERRNSVSLSGLDLGQLYARKKDLKKKLDEARIRGDPVQVHKVEVEKMRVQLQLQRNFAMAFSILSLTMIGIPLGIKVSRKETYANFGLALVLALAYYFLMIVVDWLEKSPELRPDLLVWFPNLLFQSFGIWLMFRANRH